MNPKVLLGATLLFFSTTQLRHHVAMSWDVVDPASNHFGWYVWSVMIVMLSWQWYVACLLHARAGTRQKSYLVVTLVIVEVITYRQPGWSDLVYGTTLTPDEHHALYVLDLVLNVFEGLMLAYLAVISTRRPWTLAAVVPVLALRIFVDNLVHDDLTPVLQEITRTTVVVELYGSVIIALMTIRLPVVPTRSRALECRRPEGT